ncbi:hypothetical protein ANN_21659 [Periplaneta americana]|uniref:Uncharacterized protein n=1 Tax=Periplaneta americana TaxID=6978 RepID=A0ABQ8S6E2_PERAM|nr:hypothetical protein ANN_21659 [Periplaneta americana]
MAGLCEGGNEPPGSLKVSDYHSWLALQQVLCRSASTGNPLYPSEPKFTTPASRLRSAARHVIHSSGGRVRLKPFCHNVHMSDTAMLAYRFAMFLVQYLTPLCIISCVYARMAFRLWGSRAPGNAQDSRDANLMKNKKKSVSKQASLVYRSSARVCVRNGVSIRRPEFECSGSQLEGPEFECSGPQLEGPEFEYSELALKVCGSRYCELE